MLLSLLEDTNPVSGLIEIRMRGSCQLALQKCLIRRRINIRSEIDMCTCIPLTHTKRSKAEKTWGFLVFGGAEIGWNIYRFGIVMRHSV